MLLYVGKCLTGCDLMALQSAGKFFPRLGQCLEYG